MSARTQLFIVRADLRARQARHGHAAKKAVRMASRWRFELVEAAVQLRRASSTSIVSSPRRDHRNVGDVSTRAGGGPRPA